MEGAASEAERRSPTLAVVVVTHDSAAELRRSLPPIVDELREGDELIVCDNASGDDSTAVAAELAPQARVIETGGNPGFGAACNRGAAVAEADLLLFLNPDNAVLPGFRDAIERPLLDGRDWAAWQALVTDGDGSRINSRGGVVHFTGIAWAGGAGAPRAEAPASPAPVAFPSGACLAITRERWEQSGGFSEPYFLYHEDTDLGLRLRLAGREVGIEPAAVCVHDYDFDKGPAKWRLLERNRWATLIRTYPAPLLVVLAPALIATEIALLPVAAVNGWLAEKLRASRDVALALPRLLGERREIQATRRVTAREFADALTADLDSAYLGRASRSALLRRMLRAYWSVARALLAVPPR